MSARKRSRAEAKLPRANAWWARSNDWSAAASSREGCRGGAGAGLTAVLCAAAFVAWALAVLAGADLRGCGLAAGFFFPATALARAAGRAFPTTFFVGLDFAGRLACFDAGRAAFGAEADLAGVAFRTGAFCAARLGLGFADLVVSLRLLAEVFGEAPCGAGREELLFAPLMTGSLMRSTRFSQIASCLWKPPRSEEHTSELQSLAYLVCRLLLEKKKEPHVSHTPQPRCRLCVSADGETIAHRLARLRLRRNIPPQGTPLHCYGRRALRSAGMSSR